MSELHTHYNNLKIARDAPPEIIRAAYRALCQKFHPDHNPGKPESTRTFQRIKAAYEVLSDPIQREKHDQWIAVSEAQLAASKRTVGAAKMRRVTDQADAFKRGSDHSGMGRTTRPHMQQMTDLGDRLRRPSRNLVFWASLLVISVMFVMLYHA